MKCSKVGSPYVPKTEVMKMLRRDIGKVVQVTIDRKTDVGAYTDACGLVHYVPKSVVSVATILYIQKGRVK